MFTYREQEYPMLPLVAVFWDSPNATEGADAVAHVEDALVVYLTHANGLQVRLTIYELDLLYRFVSTEVCRQEEEMFPSSANETCSSRIAGCQSNNHTECYGALWQCASCERIVCSNEGTDNDLELCDDCWAKRYSPGFVMRQPDDDIPF